MKQNQDKFILDATAGFRMMWFNKHHPNCIYLDNRPECEPDIMGDFRDLKQFPDESFELVVFDPPHIIQNSTRGNIPRDYGVLRPETWANDLKLGFKECWRVLKPRGVLIFKWSELCHKKVQDLSQYFPSAPLFGQVTANRNDSRGRNSRTYWFCFMKIQKNDSETSKG